MKRFILLVAVCLVFLIGILSYSAHKRELDNPCVKVEERMMYNGSMFRLITVCIERENEIN